MLEPIYSLGRFLQRALRDLPGSIGSNHLGLWFPIVPAMLLFAYQYRQKGWRGMRNDLIVGTIITVISYGLLFCYCVIRNLYREHVALVARENRTQQDLEWLRDRSLWSGYESEQAWRSAIDEQNRLVNLGHSVDGFFSPIQLEALKLANEIEHFLKSLGPQRVSEISKNTVEGMARQIELDWEREARIQGWYAEIMAPKVKSIVNKMLMSGYQDSVLPHFLEKLGTGENIQRVKARLWIYALRVSEVELEGES